MSTVALAATAVAGGEEPSPTGVLPPITPPAPSFTLYVDRGYGLPAPQAFGFLSVGASRARDSVNTTLDLTLGGAVGLTERLAAEISIGTVDLNPRFRYHSPQLGLFYTAVDTPPFELNFIGRLTFDAETDHILEKGEPGFYAIARVPHYLRFDVGGYVPMSPGDQGVTFGLRVPLAVSFQLAEHYHAILHSGVNVDDLRALNPTVTIPAGITIGYSEKLPSGWSAGIAPSLRFPEAMRIGPEAPMHSFPISGSVLVYLVTPP